MSDLRTLLDEAKALEVAATPGPWWWDQRGDLRPTPHDEYGLDSLIGWDPIDESPVLSDGDAAFIAASRTIVPRLIAAVEAVTEEARAEGRREVFDALRMLRDEADQPLAVDLGNMVRAWLDERGGGTDPYRSDLEQGDQP